MDLFTDTARPLYSFKSDIIIIIIIISLLIAAAVFKIYMADSARRFGLPKDKKGAFFAPIQGAPGVCIFVHQSKIKQNPIPLLEPAGIPKDYYFIANYDWRGKEYLGSLPPELFANAYRRGYDITHYSPQELADIFGETLELQKTLHSIPPPSEFDTDYFRRKIHFALEHLQGLNYI